MIVQQAAEGKTSESAFIAWKWISPFVTALITLLPIISIPGCVMIGIAMRFGENITLSRQDLIFIVQGFRGSTSPTLPREGGSPYAT
jgi:hypothetical protein